MIQTIWRHWRSLPLLLILMGALSACGGPSSAADKAGDKTVGKTAAPGSANYVLAVGQAIPVTATETLKFERVNDSRCKAGAVCVWAGYVSYSFTLSNAAGASSFTLSEAMPGGAPAATLQRLTFALVSAEPAAAPALHEPDPAYRVTLKVTVN